MRLGLTATFERGSDEGVDQQLLPFFRRVVMTYGYDRAVPEGVVAPFHLVMLGVQLDVEDQAEYEKLSRTIVRSSKVLQAAVGGAKDLQRHMSRLYAMGGHVRQAVKTFESAARARRKLLAESEAKTDAVAELAGLVEESRASVVFTQTVQAAERAAHVLRGRGILASAVHSKMSVAERRANIDALEDESLRALCAPKILDEGVDIPNLDLGMVLASARDRRQMIQRLGRVIRRKDDGRWARFIVLYARGTVEDPAHGAHEAFLELVRKAAAHEAILHEWTVSDVRFALRSEAAETALEDPSVASGVVLGNGGFTEPVDSLSPSVEPGEKTVVVNVPIIPQQRSPDHNWVRELIGNAEVSDEDRARLLDKWERIG